MTVPHQDIGDAVGRFGGDTSGRRWECQLRTSGQGSAVRPGLFGHDCYAQTMYDDEVSLQGGNASGNDVVKVGGTVRKPWLRSTESAARYMNWIRSAGVDVPDWRGRDSRGRQVLEYVPGRLAMEVGPLSHDALQQVGALVRQIHDASSSFPGDPATWDVLIPPPGATDLVCHNDLAPWNLIVGEGRLVFIDWDAAGPSTRLWDLAYSAQSFAVLDESQPVSSAARRLRAFIDGYAPDAELRAALPDAMVQRTHAMYALLRDSHARGREPWATMFSHGHGDFWSSTAGYVKHHVEAWRNALAADVLDPNA